MDNQIMPLIKRGVLNYHTTVLTPNLTIIREFLTGLNDLTQLEHNHKIEFKLNNNSIVLNIINQPLNSTVFTKNIGILEPSERFYPLKFHVNSTVFTCEKFETLVDYIFSFLESHQFAIIFYKYFPEIVTKIIETT